MDFGFSGKVVIVTGASSGLGRAIADGFAAEGVGALALHYHADRRGAEAAAASAQRLGVTAAAFGADLSVSGESEHLVGAVQEAFGRLDVLVNNAGAMVQRSPVADASDELFDKITALNYRSVFEMCRAAIPRLRASGGGAIVNISSSAARNGGAGHSVLYAGAKGALSTFSRGLAAELARENIRVNVVGPGLFDTPFHAEMTSREQLARIETTIPMGRAGQPEECAGPVLFLSSDRLAGYITGQSLEVNGGRLMP